MTYYEAIRAILALPITSSAKIVLIYLYDKQGDNVDSWPGQRTISRECSLSRQTVSDSLMYLQELNYIKIKKAKRPSIKETDRYTVNLTGLKSRPAKKTDRSKKHTLTGLLSGHKLVKKIDRNDSKNDSLNDPIHTYGDFVRLKDSDFWKLVNKLGLEKTQEMIEALNNGIGSKGYKYKSHYHTILNWVRRDEKGLNNGRKTILKREQPTARFENQTSERTDLEFVS